jgi:hypothetical protein
VVVEKYHRKVMYGNAMFVGKSFLERVDQKPQRKVENDGRKLD